MTNEQLAGYTELAQAALEDGQDLAAALRVGYRAMLCSPRFLYLTESPGQARRSCHRRAAELPAHRQHARRAT